MKKFLVASIAAVFMMVALAACGSIDKKASDSIVVGVMPDINSVPLVIAAEKGFFAEEGVNVSIQQFKSALERDSAVQSGNLDGAISDMLAVAFLKKGGFDVKAASITDGDYKLVAGAGEDANSVLDLQGKDVAVSKNTVIEYVIDRILEKNNMGDDSVNKVVIPQIPTRLEMLQNGKLAAATLPDPMGLIAIGNGGRQLASAAELKLNPHIMMFTSESIQNKNEQVKAFFRAYDRAVKYLNETDPSEYMDLVIQKAGLPESSKGVFELPKYSNAAAPAKQDVVDCVDWLVKKGLIEEIYDYSDMVYDINK